MHEPYEAHKETQHGLTIRIVHDESYDGWDDIHADDGRPVGLCLKHRRYDFPDDLDHLSPEEAMDHVNELREKGAIVLPVFMYDHSGLALSTGSFNCRWDSGQLGWAWITELDQVDYEATLRQWNKERDYEVDILTAEERITSYVEYLHDIVSGNIWGFVVEDAEGEHVDSCWGFVGDYEDDGGPLDEARRIADCEAKSKGLIPRDEDDSRFVVVLSEYRTTEVYVYGNCEEDAKERALDGGGVRPDENMALDAEVLSARELKGEPEVAA